MTIRGDQTAVSETEIEQIKAERQRRTDAWLALNEFARTIPGDADVDLVFKRARRRDSHITLDQVRRVYADYEARPHICAVFTDHSFGRSCGLGLRHGGCCPGECPGVGSSEND